MDHLLFEYSDSDQNLTVFLNCSSLIPNLHDIGCLFDITKLSWYYWFDNYSLPGACQSFVTLPMIQTVVELLMSGGISFDDALQEGFSVRWTVGSGWCRDCMDSGGFCGYDSDDDRPCFCPNGLGNGSCPRGDRPDYCGHPGFNLTCDDDIKFMIQIDNTEYQVKGVNYSNSLLTIVNQVYVGQSCPKPDENTTMDHLLFEYSDSDQNLTVFLNCSSLIPNLHDIGCLFDITKLSWYYWFDNYSLPGACQSFVTLPMIQTVVELLMSGGISFDDALQEGFSVRWTVGSGWCRDCMDSGGFCGYDSDDDRPCFCPNGLGNGSCPRGSAAVTGGLILACLLSFLYLSQHEKLPNSIFFWRKRSENSQNIKAFLERHGSLAPKRYSYNDVKRITRKFHEKLGQGGYGTVFKGSLMDGRLVAVKILSDSKGDGEEFINEVASIGRTSHVNIVSLLGFCSEGSKRALIYEYMPNGSLDKYIYSEKSILGLEILYQIAIGVAQGLEYLHRGCNTRIVHFDIKPHNIILDQEFCPKISDFGLAKLCPAKISMLSMADPRGTIGFIAPEVFSRNFGVVSSKSDVYSYGMMVLEMVGGRKNLDVGVGKTSEIYFPHWVYKHMEQDGYLQAYGVTVETEEIARKMILVGLWCIQTKPETRPSMSKVVDMLQGSLSDLQMPPNPVLSVTQVLNVPNSELNQNDNDADNEVESSDDEIVESDHGKEDNVEEDECSQGDSQGDNKGVEELDDNGIHFSEESSENDDLFDAGCKLLIWKKSNNAQDIEVFLETCGSLAPKRYRYMDIKKITKNFHDKLGQGGYGSVFKGSLDDGRLVAVKILSDSKGNGEEFVNEVASIGRTSHVNIVSLLGFCSEGSKRALIYEFMPNGSLEKYIYSEKLTSLGLEKLYQIAVGIARGLEYLHRGCNTRIVHFDIKPHNILLDEEVCPKISDFGLAKLCPTKDSTLSLSDARGTIGYIAPEVFSRNFGVVSSKSDVYSYGMMVLEMVGGRKNMDAGVGNTSEIYFPHWIYEHLDQDGDLQAFGVTCEMEEIARKMILVGLWCIQTMPGNRPSMSKVLDMFQGSVNDLQMPPKPCTSSSESSLLN
ncbi:putative LEAF RUST 10 DISEASE-RESISTANCE LOCUS RECEPTOR-LIKE PROTEIN KINASE-like 2.4 [Cocos nucifera]|uniref:Putative LEAF RUST 10 DISEASE-RESISTANCE LOCUS RECEPTOR-LIKE PROTEIN KINASE-like 2.4 n=1 Tax=Cocos nucifera TaxID=13894 RepID=A0A8K0MZ83_COCNU|nr:putative LEAF RUST 10 DISEASE-RESISTANCE LOCUS RECEPTOR-LIKE PROTEIN KINASE-like 2.4 [Cocos nucifera]